MPLGFCSGLAVAEVSSLGGEWRVDTPPESPAEAGF